MSARRRKDRTSWVGSSHSTPDIWVATNGFEASAGQKVPLVRELPGGDRGRHYPYATCPYLLQTRAECLGTFLSGVRRTLRCKGPMKFSLFLWGVPNLMDELTCMSEGRAQRGTCC